MKYEMRFRGEERSLVAVERFHQGETILGLPHVTQQYPDKYSLEASPGIHVDCSFVMAGAINHSCNPSASVRNFNIVAWRCIEAGEEITLDYRKTENKLANPFDCECGYCPPGTRIE